MIKKIMKREFDIQSMIMAVLTLLTVVTSILMGFLLYNRYGNAMRQMEIRDTQTLLQSTANSLESYLRNMRQIGDTINYSVVQEMDVSDAQFNQELSLLYEANKDKIQSIVLCDNKGTLIAAEPVTVQNPVWRLRIRHGLI